MKKVTLLFTICFLTTQAIWAQQVQKPEKEHEYLKSVSQFEKQILDVEASIKSGKLPGIRIISEKIVTLPFEYEGFDAEMKHEQKALYDFKLNQGFQVQNMKRSSIELGTTNEFTVRKTNETFNIKRNNGNPTVWKYDIKVYDFLDEQRTIKKQLIFSTYSIKEFGLGASKISTFYADDINPDFDSKGSLQEDYVNGITLFPNPVKNEINIKNCVFDTPFSIGIYNSQSQLLLKKEYLQNEKVVLNIELSDLPNGIYALVVQATNEVKLSKKFIILKK